MRMSLSSKPSMMRISTAAGSAALKNEEVVGSLSFGRLSYENADRALAAHFWPPFTFILPFPYCSLFRSFCVLKVFVPL